jgi:GR25 family glycosyltransferase involved in LPS biosynthesis
MDTWVINRSDRPERLHDVRIELENQQINAHRFEAIICPIGYMGCAASHLAIIIEKCKNQKIFMVLEDDAEFLLDREAVTRILADAMEELPSDWDLLYLGCSPQKPQVRYSDSLFLIDQAKCTHAMIWHNRDHGAIEYILNHKSDIRKIDRYLYEVIQPKFNCFATFPMLVTQKQSKSDVSKRSDCSTIEKNYNKYCV